MMLPVFLAVEVSSPEDTGGIIMCTGHLVWQYLGIPQVELKDEVEQENVKTVAYL